MGPAPASNDPVRKVPGDKLTAWDLWKPRLACLGLGLALGSAAAWVLGRSSAPRPAEPAGKTSAPMRRSPVVPPARGSGPAAAQDRQKPVDAIPETVRRDFQTLVREHGEKLRTRLPVPRPGALPHHAGRIFHATLRDATHAARPTGLASRPFAGDAVFSILWYCNGKLIEPQEIRASYYYEYGAWRLDRAVRRTPTETVSDAEDLAWVRKLFQ